ncbi:hypothetical protein FDP41_011281 [Naegleria fowleri]|uniref:Uncharacterized protein n=1 Tax=Naegleria fowleri TaxID=5763 RepID=A0A6A5C5H9_NAEFO|nr:uncharacterized protein FDP41_011281 [Naegleria fowleri]KAF0982351.1 hypothetical protein FDP41_011281 [Naegleria fowleri]
MSLDAQTIYYCDSNIEKYEYCKRSETPNDVIDPVDLSSLTESCSKNPNKLVFARSYVDITSVNTDTFLTLLYCYGNENSTSNQTPFRYYLAYDLTVTSASKFLTESTRTVTGSKSFFNLLCIGKIQHGQELPFHDI